MNDRQFRALLNLVMASDPTPLSDEEDDTVRDLLANEAHKRGFMDWIEAFHDFQPAGDGQPTEDR